MKQITCIFSILYVVILSSVLWIIWTGETAFREGYELRGKIVITTGVIGMGIISNWAIWSLYLRRKR